LKRVLRGVLTALLGILAVCVLGAVVLVVTWLVRREDPTSFLPDRYVAYVQVPSLRGIYDQWLTLEAADVVLARPELAPYHGVLTDARGLALTRAPVLRTLLDVRADVMLLPDGKFLAVLDIGWRGILTPLARFVGPLLRVKGFSFLNDAGLPMYRYTAGATTIHAALAGNVVIVSIDADTVKEALARRASHTGLAARASRELLDRIRLRSSTAVRVLVDTQGIGADLLGATPLGAKVLDAVEIPGQTMLDVQLSNTRLQLGVALPVSVSLPELSKILAAAPAPIGVLRYVPSSAQLLTVSNIAPLADLYRLAAAFQGRDVQDIYARADSGARTVLGAGIDELLFSWVGAEVGAFMQPGSAEAVFFAKITDSQACTRALGKLTSSIVAGKDSSLVLDGVRIDKLSLPWYVGLILDALGVNAPEPYFLVRDNYIFVSLDAQNLAAVVKAADTGDNLAQTSLYARLAERIPADSSFLAWYDVSRSEPFFIRGSGLLADILRLYANGVVAVRATPADVRVSLAAARVAGGGAKLLPGFPLAPSGVVSGDVLAFRFADSSSLTLAWIRDRSVLVLADPTGAQIAEAKLEPDSVLVPEQVRPGTLAAIWAVSPGGTIWRFGAKLLSLAPFPLATGIVSPMPPAMIDGKLALFSKTESALVLVGPDGSRGALSQRLEAPLFAPPDFLAGRTAFYPKSFDAWVHLSDLKGAEAPGWPVQAAGISYCAPRIVASGQSFVVTFLTQAGTLHVWDLSGKPVPPFPITLPGVFYATPGTMSVDGRPVLVTLAQDGVLRQVGLDGTVLRQTSIPDLDGKDARILIADLAGDGREEILLYGSGAFVAGYDAAFRPLPGFPLKGVSRPQLVDLDRDGRLDVLTAGLDGKIYAYAAGRGRK
jgi:hypothetical protein